MIDTHIHLNDERYKEDLDEVLLNYKKNNVEKIILIGCDIEGIKRALEIQKNDKDNFIYLSIGIHPVDAKEWDDSFIEYFKDIVSKNDKIVALGEMGLDYYHDPDQKESQKNVFKKQIKLAKDLNLPIIIHSRDAVNDCYKILEEENYFNGVIHAFSEDYNSAEKFLKKGMYIGIGGPITFKNGDNQKNVVKEIDIEKLLIETDGPYLTPVPFRGQRNESTYLRYVIEEIAKIKNKSYNEIEKQTTKNAYNLFGGRHVR